MLGHPLRSTCPLCSGATHLGHVIHLFSFFLVGIYVYLANIDVANSIRQCLRGQLLDVRTDIKLCNVESLNRYAQTTVIRETVVPLHLFKDRLKDSVTPCVFLEPVTSTTSVPKSHLPCNESLASTPRGPPPLASVCA